MNRIMVSNSSHAVTAEFSKAQPMRHPVSEYVEKRIGKDAVMLMARDYSNIPEEWETEDDFQGISCGIWWVILPVLSMTMIMGVILFLFLRKAWWL